MKLISKINYEISRMSNIKIIDPRQLPCQFCVEDHGARQEMVQVQNLGRNNTNFAKELMATYHAILHTDFRSGMQILYYKDIRNLMGVQILAKSGWKAGGGNIQNVHRHSLQVSFT
jgi:hypothetical protein